jgi:hypothetical protein
MESGPLSSDRIGLRTLLKAAICAASRLARAVGLRGRARRAGSHAERARINVSRAIAAAPEKIAARHPVLGAHFTSL